MDVLLKDFAENRVSSEHGEQSFILACLEDDLQVSELQTKYAITCPWRQRRNAILE